MKEGITVQQARQIALKILDDTEQSLKKEREEEAINVDNMYNANDFDTEPVGINEFIETAKSDLDNFSKNVIYLENLANKQMTQFEWYMTFGYWCEWLDHFRELEKRMEEKPSSMGKLKEKLQKIADEKRYTDDDDFCPMESSGSNFDDAYSYGRTDGRIGFARKLLKEFFGD